MNTSLAICLNLILACALANLPFSRALERGLQAGSQRLPRHWRHAVTWLLCYGLWMGLATLLASGGGTAPPMGWEVWTVTLALFAVLAFPGVVWRYLLQPRPTGNQDQRPLTTPF